jgi:hypothetical protein
MSDHRMRADWRPSPALEAAVRKALQVLARHWPRAMAMAMDASEAGSAYVADFARAMHDDVELPAIPHAAQLWVRDHKTPPKPAELGRLARELSAPRHSGLPAGAACDPPPPPPGAETAQRKEALSQRALAELRRTASGTTAAGFGGVAMVWALLMETAPDPAARDRVRAGDVPEAEFMAAVAAVARGRRPRTAGSTVAEALPGALGQQRGGR